MITIKPLTTFRADDLAAIMPGYTSAEIYQVTRHDSDDQISFELQLVMLPEPYIKQWTMGKPAEVDRYQAIVSTGLSLGTYDGQQLVGIAICEAQPWNHSLLVWEFGVTASQRRRGIGRRLIHAVAEQAHREHLRTLVVETQNTNVPAIRFYRAVGFKLDGIDLLYYAHEDFGPQEVALFMKRQLP